MPTTLKQTEQGTPVTLLSAELNSLASNANAVSTGSFANNAGVPNWDGYVDGKLELSFTPASGTPAASTSFDVYFLLTVDGTNYEDGGASVTPARLPDVVIPVRNAAGAQRVTRRCLVPVGTFRVLVRNNATGVAMAASGNTLRLLLGTDTGV